MTTDNAQEPRDLIQICTDIYYECETIKHLDELTDEALDWHNKQVEALLDRLEAEGQIVDTRLFKREIVATPHSAIEAERKRLKEGK